jgi:hypothetical protein
MFARNILLVISLGILAPAAHAQRATEEDLAQSALQSAFRSNGESDISALVQKEKRNVNSGFTATTDKEAIRSATLVFNHGMSPDEAAKFADQFDFEVMRAEVKNAIGGNGRIATMSIGTSYLFMLEGTVAEKLRKSIGVQQMRLGQLAQNGDDESSKLLAETAYAPNLKIYTLEVIGTLNAMNKMTDLPEVAAIRMDEGDGKVRNHEALKSQIEGTVNRSFVPVIGRRLEDGPPPGVDPSRIVWRGLIQDTGQDSTQGR